VRAAPLDRLHLPPRWRAYLVVAGCVLLLFGVVLWAILGINAFWAVFGIVLGVGLAGFWAPMSAPVPATPPAAGVAPQPFGRLVRSALPLVLPLLIFVVAGTAEKGILAQLAVGAVASLVAWLVIIRPELRRLTVRILLATAALALGFGIAAYIINDVQDFTLGGSDDRGGLSAAFLQTAVVLWGCAIVFRLASFATSLVRMIEALAIAAALLFVIWWTGVLPAPGTAGDDGLEIARWIALGAAALLLSEALAGVVGAALGHGNEVRVITTNTWGIRPNGARRLAGVGLSAALLAAFALGGAAVAGLDETRAHDRGFRVNGKVITPGIPAMTPEAQLEANPASVVRTYMPELAFRADQPWLPTRVEDYVNGAGLQGVHGRETTVHSLDELPGPDDCPGLTPSPCFHLTIHCPRADSPDGCSQADPVGPGEIAEPNRSGAVYVHVVRKPQQPMLFPKGVGTINGQKPWLLIEYWYFYRYDEWSSPILAGTLVQRHEGDWEAVAVGLSRKKPLFVAYSQHARGGWRPWESIQVSPISRRHTHPLVAVAKGSQANYPEANQGIAPDWAEGSGVLPAGTVGLLSYASNIRDRTGYGYGWLPAEDGIVRANDRRPPMSFPGFWGGHDTAGMSLENERAHAPRLGGEPKTPSMQSLWVEPLTTVFCKWHGPLHADRKDTCPSRG
jgi:hypothetical protein